MCWPAIPSGRCGRRFASQQRRFRRDSRKRRRQTRTSGWAGLRLAELELEVGSGQHRGELFHPRQRLDAALRLLGLACLGLERSMNFCRCAMRSFCFSKFAAPARGGSTASPRTRCSCRCSGRAGLVDVSLTLVTASRNSRSWLITIRSGVALQPGLEPDERVEVEVVGRLVEEHQVGQAHQSARELQAHSPAAREARHRRVELADLEAEAEQHCLRARPGVEAAGEVIDSCACAIPWPSSLASARASSASASARAVSPARTKSVAPCGSRASPARPRRGASVAARRRRRHRRAAGRRGARTATICRRRCGRPGRPSRRAGS